MFEAFKSVGRKIGAWEDDPKPEVQTSQAPIQQTPVQQPIVMAPPVLGVGFGMPVVDEAVYNGIMSAISAGVDNNLKKLHDMSETMRVAIPDEGMRIRAAAAAAGLTADNVILTIDTLTANVAIEKDRFMRTEIAAQQGEVTAINDQIEATKRQIDELQAQIEQAVAKRDELTNMSAQKTAETQNIIAIFEATASKVLQDLELEKKRIGIYVPVGV